VHPRAAEQVFFRDCLIMLGTCLAPVGKLRPGRLALELEMDGQSHCVHGGEIALVPLQPGEKREVSVRPGPGLNLGAGPGKCLTVRVEGGVTGIILDGRGRPLPLPPGEQCAEVLARWEAALQAYPASGETSDLPGVARG
jgi:hypothetical protein